MLETRHQEFEQTVLVGLITSDQDIEKSKEYLDEFDFFD